MHLQAVSRVKLVKGNRKKAHAEATHKRVVPMSSCARACVCVCLGGIEDQDTFDHDKRQKSAVSGKFLHFIFELSPVNFAFFTIFSCNLASPKMEKILRFLGGENAKKILSRLWLSRFFSVARARERERTKNKERERERDKDRDRYIEREREGGKNEVSRCLHGGHFVWRFVDLVVPKPAHSYKCHMVL